MNDKTQKGLYVIGQILWKSAITAGKMGVTLCGLALLTNIIQDLREKKYRKVGN